MDPLRLKSIYTAVRRFMEKHIFTTIKVLSLSAEKCLIKSSFTKESPIKVTPIVLQLINVADLKKVILSQNDFTL